MAKRKRTKRKEKFEDTKGVIKSHQLTKDIEYNSQKKIRTKRQTHIYQTLQRELKIEQQGRHKNKVVYYFRSHISSIIDCCCFRLSVFISSKKKYKVFLINYEEFEDTKVVIRIRKSKDSRQHNGKKKKSTT